MPSGRVELFHSEHRALLDILTQAVDADDARVAAERWEAYILAGMGAPGALPSVY
jgi:hypothetical protein